MGEPESRLLQRPRRPEVALCTKDTWAIGALAACAEHGLRVPEDIAITGFNSDLIGQFIHPPLTTMAHQLDAMANKAVDLWVKQIRGTHLRPATSGSKCRVNWWCGNGAVQQMQWE
jgi:LacI family gluconate utilization system Gnt-I transcriptional repressor